LYPFTNCTDCGPRLTIIEDIPYDRPKTSMKTFPMCPACQKEYETPANRRFHAQPNACPECGPALSLVDCRGIIQEERQQDIPSLVGRLLRNGHIMAIKGLGGYHLACDGQNQKAVNRLRQGKIREDRPFALMVKDLQVANKLVVLSPEEEQLLTDLARPIVVLTRKERGLPGYDSSFCPLLPPAPKRFHHHYREPGCG
ncbi:MAG TPA: Sua5/YciO/YrdC/YwlC family protein, partial [Bacillota bacterium]|nr:Sua5/YciO/YrdC/YwlC family protein [Bacillota bacterium]